MTGDEFRVLALSFAGTTQAPHFDRTAFKAKRIFATLAADGRSANLLLTPEEQEFYSGVDPAGFRRLPNKWGDQGWTCATLADVDPGLMRDVLAKAWQLASPSKPARSRRK
ncbi:MULTISPECIES: MmcQ/YjbR family DNA-binding protein [unclassified Bradyrhizobium]|uniref:MmcQ/YjbR family DNA-binding protein n=1 Tax=unclassified Bradyrhizobium TaxID=2631580 RepID=UPI0028E5BC4B|nr:MULTISPECIES: MmcQ/YjbR family DNA-binding protein [unclassified Bradyrhizobium]